MTMRQFILLCLLCGLTAFSFGDTALAAKSPVDKPVTYEMAMEYYYQASQSGDWAAAEQALKKIQARNPSNLWPALVLGHLLWSSGETARAEAVYSELATEFAAADIDLGEITALVNLSTLLSNRGAWQDTNQLFARIKRITEQSTDPEVRVRGLRSQAARLIALGKDLGQARSLLVEAQADAALLGSYWLKRAILHSLGTLDTGMGSFQEAARHYGELAVMAQTEGDIATLSQAQFDTANSLLEALSEAPELNNRNRVHSLAEKALANAETSSRPFIQALAHRLLGELSLGKEPDRALEHFNRCVSIADQIDNSRLSDCSLFKARALANVDDPRALSVLQSALSTVDAERAPAVVNAWGHHMRVSWRAKPIDMAIADGERALAMIETLRDLQSSELERAGVLSAWTRNYYWLSGQLLKTHPNQYASDAFAITEQMRSRVLYERIQWGNNQSQTLSPSQSQNTEALNAQLKTISNLNKQILISTDLAQRANLLAELKQAESALARHEILGSVPSDLDIPGIAEIQERLAPDELLLSFQLGADTDAGGEYAGGAWLIAISQNRVMIKNIPDRGQLRSSIPVFLGMFDPKVDSPAQAIAAQALYTKLFGQVLDDFGPEIKRLVIIPDDILYRLPLAALRHPSSRRTLIEDYQINIAPSATMWHHWQESVPKQIPGAALVFANPEVSWAMAGNVSGTRSWAPGTLAQISSLPAAEQEGKEIASVLANGSVLEWRDQASEGKFKTIDKTPFGIVHFAAHAVIDEQNPDRSAVILADSELEDGLLQAREIANLEAVPPLVVLASCQGANGSLVRGEGVLGLARSFYIAGAGAVVGNLWPVQDEHARSFMRPFYSALKRGESATEAFNSAQLAAQRAGLPASVWAGFQLMGYGNMRIEQHQLL